MRIKIHLTNVFKHQDLGYQDVVELREQLVHANLTFAIEIANIQEGITKNLVQLMDYTASLVNFPIKPSQFVEVSLIPPVVLMLQLIEMTASSASNITATFQNLQIPFDPYYFLERYVPFIDWTEFKAASEKADMERKTGELLGAVAQQQLQQTQMMQQGNQGGM